MELSAEERRVLGCLFEKQATTPDQYPLTTNALVNACNQKSNREPVVTYSERTVMDAALQLRQAGLARMNSSGRTDKHRQIADDALGLDRDQLALLAIMLLRGPQSAGELRTRTERYPTSQGFGFESLDDIEAVLARLAEGTDPLVANIGRGPGQSQDRWSHLLGDGAEERDVDAAEVSMHDGPVPGSTRPDGGGVRPAPDRDAAGPVAAIGTAPETVGELEALRRRVAQLEARLAALEDALGVETSVTDAPRSSPH
ncbi:MAG: YceH family protein [Ilumatobacter sp.]|uniref:YceH family protein n=1 Tax=Ilumatobacter sp. TaxID=1967498 RepID=UPI00391B07E1